MGPEHELVVGKFLKAVAAPTATPPAGTYPDVQTVSLSSDTPGAAIRYTTDGSEPTAMSPMYTGSIPVTSNLTIRALGLLDGWFPSPEASRTYEVRVATPTLTPPPGTYANDLSVTLALSTAGAVLRFTTDGSVPTEGSSAYQAPIPVGATTPLVVCRSTQRLASAQN